MIINANVLDWAEAYDGPLFHAVLCDPPYGLNERELDINAVLADWMAGREHCPAGRGFMGKAWDSFIPGPAIWRAVRRCCHPGALLFAFGGTRTADLLALALRLAGWEKIDELAWVYGSGFPKNHNLGKAMDRRAGASGAVVGRRRHQPKFDAAGLGYREKDNGFNDKARDSFDVTVPASPEGRTWAGHGTALKPAHEPILVFRNPFAGTYAANCAATGAGALWIEGGRVGDECLPDQRAGQARLGTFERHNTMITSERTGRWPANLILQHSHACGDACASDCPIAMMDQQSGASRFFFCADWSLERIADADPFLYAAKASRGEREAGLDPRTLALLGDDGDVLEEGSHGRICRSKFAHDTIDDGRAMPIDNPYQRGETRRRNIHPTVKPIAITRYLATLLLPPAAYAPRRLLVPFAGVASEMIGADLAGWEETIGIELDATHCQIAEARRAYWRQICRRIAHPAQPVRVRTPAAPADQADMFGEAV